VVFRQDSNLSLGTDVRTKVDSDYVFTDKKRFWKLNVFDSVAIRISRLVERVHWCLREDLPLRADVR
jgi:hypothetical protein